MTKRHESNDINTGPTGVNPGYAAFQIAKALATSEEHEDVQTRERAKQRIAKWETVLRNIGSGSAEYGSRTPVEGVPAWATLEVITGGFATGGLLAAGPLQEHEKRLLETLPELRDGEYRSALNWYFLTDAGLADLRKWLQTGCYDVAVPEEGALLVAAWLAEKGHAAAARDLIETLSPYFPSLRFYPIPLERPRRFGSRMHVQDVGAVLDNLRQIKPNKRVLAQKEAVDVWAPLYDRMVALFLETVEDDWPCQQYPAGWPDRALALLGEYAELRKEYRLCKKLERTNQHYGQLREFLGKCARNPKALTGREAGRIRLILARYVQKRGAPDSAGRLELRRRQATDVSAPTHHQIARVVISRLEKHAKDDGLDRVDHLNQPVKRDEAASTMVPEGTSVPRCLQRKVERCLNEAVEVLIERGLITSGETLAKVLPQITADLRAAAITDPTLRPLYAAIYRAFRRRRSLLLLNLEKQVQIEELPWVAAIDRFRRESLSSRELARQTLEEIVIVALASFPHAILPNKLLQELRALVKGADLDIPLVDELAADIFMGQFSGKFVESAKLAADLLTGTLYATYYGIDYEDIRRIPGERDATKRKRFWQQPTKEDNGFAKLCASRAGVSLGTWDPAQNGMIIEQQQILTTQNLAALFVGLDLTQALQGQLDEMAKHCFRWICRRLQMKVDQWHGRLIMLKNTAYAWRQMVFFLSLLPKEAMADFLRWAEQHLAEQTGDFQNRFQPALQGLMLASKDIPPTPDLKTKQTHAAF